MLKWTFLFFSIFLVSCYPIDSIPYLFRDEWIASEAAGVKDDSLAIITWSRYPAELALIDGDSLRIRYKKAKLLPGRHIIGYEYSPEYDEINTSGTIRSFEIELKSGHQYELRMKYHWWTNIRRYEVWVVDKTSFRENWRIIWGEVRMK